MILVELNDRGTLMRKVGSWLIGVLESSPVEAGSEALSSRSEKPAAPIYDFSALYSANYWKGGS